MDANRLDIFMSTILDSDLAVGKTYYGHGIGRKEGISQSDFYDILAISPLQTHSLNVGVIESGYERYFPDTDALVTFHDDIPIGVRTADCVPILLYADDVNGTAAIHAGWKGTLEGIVDKTLDVLQERGADLSKLLAVFGPSISKEFYEVDNELADKFVEAGFGEYVSYPEGKDAKPHLDLQGVNIARLTRRGVSPDNIKPSDRCTFSSRTPDGEYAYPSYRRDKTTDRFLTSIMKLNKEKLEAEKRHWARVFKSL